MALAHAVFTLVLKTSCGVSCTYSTTHVMYRLNQLAHTLIVSQLVDNLDSTCLKG